MNPEAADAGWQRLDFGGGPHAIRLAGFDRPLEVALPNGGLVRWPARTYADHLGGLRAGLALVGTRIELDLNRYLAAMPDHALLSATEQAALQPLALWWAGGCRPANAAPVLPAEDGSVEIEARRFSLRPWSARARLAAMLASLRERDADATGGTPGGDFDAVGYLDAMVRATLVQDAASATAAPLETLPTRWALPLIDAAVGVNVLRPEAEPLPGTGPQAQAAAAQTLRLCRALGWTPTQVWAAPAIEVDRLLALLDRAEPVPAPAARAPRPAARPAPRRLADHPDAVLIRIDESAP